MQPNLFIVSPIDRAAHFVPTLHELEYVDHTPYEFGSLLSLVEAVFGVPSFYLPISKDLVQRLELQAGYYVIAEIGKAPEPNSKK